MGNSRLLIMDTIFIENLRLDCLVGVTPEERARPQKVVVDVRLGLDLSAAAASKKVGDTIDYREARRQISEVVTKGDFLLLESLAEEVASVALAMARVDKVHVRVRKERYTTEPSIGIEVERSRVG